MRKMVKAGAMAAVMAAMAAGVAEAGMIGKVAAAVSGEVVALVVSAAIALLAGAFGVLFVRVARTFRETGEFLTALGCALDDRRITREELAGVIKEGKEIFEIWR